MGKEDAEYAWEASGVHVKQSTGTNETDLPSDSGLATDFVTLPFPF